MAKRPPAMTSMLFAERSRRSWLQRPVHLTARDDAKYQDDQGAIVDVIDDPVPADADATSAGRTGERDRLGRPGIVSKHLNGIDDPPADRRIEPADSLRAEGRGSAGTARQRDHLV